MTIYFPDVSGFQAGISFSGALVVFDKAAQGITYANPDYYSAKQRAAQAGTYFCAYHFLEQGRGAAQAQHAFNVVGAGIPLMLDFEAEYDAFGNLISAPSVSDAADFIDAYRQLGGTVYFVYLPHWYWAQVLKAPSLSALTRRGMLLWSSIYQTYTDASTGIGWQPYGGMTPVIWQYTSSLPFNGMTIDFNAFRGHYAGKEDPASVAATLAEFKALATTGKYPAPVTVEWGFKALRELKVIAAGYTSVKLEWTSPDGFTGSPPGLPGVGKYEIAVFNGSRQLPSYPRWVSKDDAHPTQSAQFGSLPQDTVLTAWVRALSVDGKHSSPWSKAEFKTGVRPAKVSA